MTTSPAYHFPASEDPQPGWHSLSSRERMTILLLAATAAILRIATILHYRFDSDEPQHLHVAWGWTAGYVQYRDYFDNHAPLFHMVTAPILAAIGERPDAMLLMRLPMLPLFGVVLWGTWVLSRRLYDCRTALWTTLILLLLPPFFLKSVEYRTDNLWNALWSVVLVVITGGPPSAARMFLTGLLLGCALAVSMKTSLLIVTLAFAAAATSCFVDRNASPVRWAKVAFPLLAGVTIVPAAVVMVFVRAGAWSQLVYCVAQFNEVVPMLRPNSWMARALYPFTFAALVMIARKAAHGGSFTAAERWRYFFGLAAGMFAITLCSFWVLISPRDMLPLMPLAAMFAVTKVGTDSHTKRHRLAFLSGTAALLLLLIARDADWFRDHTDEHITMMRQVLALSRPGEPLMDLKGETIFRQRPFYFIFELITREQMQRGLIADRVAESVIRSGCHIAQADGGFFPPAGRAFLNDHFIDLGRLRASGHWLADDGAFEIAVPGRYVLVNNRGGADGMLDDQRYRGGRFLAAGKHLFRRGHPNERIAYLWENAFARGFSPFHPRDRNF